MNDIVKILGIAGSLRIRSYNKGLLRSAIADKPKDVEIETFNIGKLPLFDEDLEGGQPREVQNLKNRIKEADAVLFVTPEYNYSIPGVLKNAIDWGSRPYIDNSWAGKPVAVMGASTSGFGTVRSQMHLRQCFVFLDMHPINRPELMISNAAEKFDENGNLTDDKIKSKIINLIEALRDWARQIRGQSY